MTIYKLTKKIDSEKKLQKKPDLNLFELAC